MSLSRLAAACTVAALALSQPARAQEPTLRGPYVGLGLGTASAAVNCDICSDDRNGGLSGHLAAGLTFSPTLRAGAELTAWQDNTNNIRQRMVMYGATVYWTASPAAAWYLKGGLGMLTYNAQDVEDDEDDPLGASTAALQLGVGYDLRAGRKLWFSPFANMVVSTSGNLTSGNSIVTDASFSLMQIGMGLTWR
jgi:hypothetical protein